MASERKSAKKRDPNQITAVAKPDEDHSVTLARTVLRPSVQAAVTPKEYDKPYGDLDIAGLIESLTEQIRASNDGDPKRAEAAGKTRASRNAYKGVQRKLCRTVSRVLRAQLQALDAPES